MILGLWEYLITNILIFARERKNGMPAIGNTLHKDKKQVYLNGKELQRWTFLVVGVGP